ncbi:MAG: hypothetical protein WAX14_11470 [Rhodococcus sp. (in: high G+C Gram-positive bacteria)]|uniref:hypothetical protein n=1 Tax=Rhodococcus sp. TaxID=1831 RepID=UPI003BB62D8D
MALTDITRESVLQAVAEHDKLGRTEFLELYHFRPARKYHLVLNGKRYDSKAITGVAHGYATGTNWTSSDFSGGAATVGRTLGALGFNIEVD